MSESIEERVEKLEAAGLDVRDRLVRIEVKLEHCATREDFALTRSDLASVRTELAAVRTEVALQGTRMQEAMAVLTWRIIGLMTGVSTALVATTFFLARYVN